jgi:lipoate-protein ligase A
MAAVTRRGGTVRELHELDPLADASSAAHVWWMQPEDTAIVLGSRQSPDIVDTAECARLGIDVVKRRSGGGAVLVVPDQLVWVDIVAPPGGAPDDVPNDVPNDVRGSMLWAGEMWQRALMPFVGDGGELTVHGGSMIATPWSDLVCFAGLGPGEVSLDGRKLVGLSQRRTRNGVRIQGTLYTAPPDIDLARLLRPPRPAMPLPAVASLAVAPAEVVGRLAAELAFAGDQRG